MAKILDLTAASDSREIDRAQRIAENRLLVILRRAFRRIISLRVGLRWKRDSSAKSTPQNDMKIPVRGLSSLLRPRNSIATGSSSSVPAPGSASQARRE